MSVIVHITSEDEFQKLLSSSRVVVADFYADWCGPCKQIAPYFESLATKFSKADDVVFCKVNVDTQKSVAASQSIRAMPTFIVFKSGTVAYRVLGTNRRVINAAIEWGVDAEAAAAKGLEEPKAETSESWFSISNILPIILSIAMALLMSNFPTQAIKDFFTSK